MSQPQYEAIEHSLPFIMEPPPTALTFEANDTAAVQDDKKLVYYTRVYNFELETNLTTALKNIIMEKLDEATYIHLKELYVGYDGLHESYPRHIWRKDR